MKPRIREVIIVEGRYDKNVLSQVVDAVILTTEGFGVFRDKEKLSYFRRLAERRGVILLTDPDGAGFVIRNYLKGAIDGKHLRHAYIPDIPGKERRKSAPGKEGKLGVEGMTPQVILDALRKAGATVLGEDEKRTPGNITKQDMMELGLSGAANSSALRKQLLKKLDLPEHMSSNALLQAVNLLYTRDELRQLLSQLGENHD